MKLKHFIFCLLISIPVFRVEASAIDFRLGSRTAEFGFLTESSTFGYGGADMGIGVFIDENDNFMVNGSILVSGSSDGDVRALQLGVGIKVYAGVLDTPNDDSGAGLGLGGQLRYVFPSNTPVAILFEGWVVPEVVSMSDFDGILEYRIAIELEVTPSARGYVGFRHLEVEVDGFANDLELDDRAHVGVKFSF
jgi:hypothetical protein